MPPSETDTLIAEPQVGTERPDAQRLPAADLGDRLWAAALTAIGAGVLAVAGLVVVVLTRASAPAVSQIGAWHFVSGQDWDPVSGHFGALPFIYGTVVTSLLAIALALPVSIGLALFLAEMGPPSLKRPVSFRSRLLAAIPSVVYGLWGLFVLVPMLRSRSSRCWRQSLGFLPLFQGPPIGLGYLAAGLILADHDPAHHRLGDARGAAHHARTRCEEGALALGATRWEMIRMTVLPYARPRHRGRGAARAGRARSARPWR